MKAILLLLVTCVALFSSYGQTHPEITLESRSTGTGYALCGSCSLPKEISSRAWLVLKDEPGEQIILSGRIFKEDGVTPDSGITLFLYQTDAGGYYHRPQEDVFHPRLFGWLRTGSDGQYEIHTIKPAPEILAADEPAHIHVHIFGNGMPEHFLHEFWFQGDRNISAEELRASKRLGTFSPIVALKKESDGILRVVRNIRVRPAPPWKYEQDMPQK
jgi:protocatechuate 3,4-dioxygenase beta subunit